MEEYYFQDEHEKKGARNSAKKKKDLFLGVIFNLLWFFIVIKLNVFMAYGDAILLYLFFLFIILVWARIRKNLGSLYGYILGTVVPLFFYVIVYERNIWALTLYAAVIAVCVFKLFKVD